MMIPAVEAHNLHKWYGKFHAVKGISFRIESSEIFGFLGPNGAGKTTTMRMIHGLVDKTEGVLKVLGEDISTYNRELKRLLGVVPQEANLDQELSVLENLLVYSRYFDIPRRIALSRAMEWLEFFHLESRLHSNIKELSGGMRKRLLIVRGLLNNPCLLILDEPTTGLDPQTRQVLWDKIYHLNREKGITILLTTHYMEEAEQLCHRLVIMHEGTIRATGTPEGLIQCYLPPDVVELRGNLEKVQSRLSDIMPPNSQSIALQDRLIIYTEKAEELMVNLKGQLPELDSYLLRRTNLEDLYLYLTGRGLGE